MSYAPNDLRKDEVNEIRAAIEAAVLHANRINYPVILRSDLTSERLTPKNEHLGLEIIQPVIFNGLWIHTRRH